MSLTRMERIVVTILKSALNNDKLNEIIIASQTVDTNDRQMKSKHDATTI